MSPDEEDLKSLPGLAPMGFPAEDHPQTGSNRTKLTVAGRFQGRGLTLL